MLVDLIGIVAGAFAPDIRAKAEELLLGERLARDIRAAIARWGNELPEPLRTGVHVPFGSVLFNADRTEHAQAGSARTRLMAVLGSEGLPDQEVWFQALAESWSELRASLAPEARNAFLRITASEATRHLQALAHEVAAACRKNEDLFRTYIETALRTLLAQNTKSPPQSFAAVTAVAHSIDEIILRTVRDHRHISSSEVVSVYRALMEKYLLDAGLASSSFSRALSSSDWISPVVATLPIPSLRIAIDAGATCMRFEIDGQALVVDSAMLLWDCNCRAPVLKSDGSLIAFSRSHRDCPIHRHGPLGDRVGSSRLSFRGSRFSGARPRSSGRSTSIHLLWPKTSRQVAFLLMRAAYLT